MKREREGNFKLTESIFHVREYVTLENRLLLQKRDINVKSFERPRNFFVAPQGIHRDIN